MDRARFVPDRVFLSDEAASRATTTEGFIRRITSSGKQRPESVSLSVVNGRNRLFKVAARRLTDGRWHVTDVDLNFPGLLHGHNGIPLKSNDEVALALTRLRHWLGLIASPDSRSRVIPGVGTGNSGYLTYLENMVQLQDPSHRMLLASHLAARPYQHKPPMICWGESTRFLSREHSLSIYDKHAQRRKGHLEPPDIPCVRIEFCIKDARRLASAVGGCSKAKAEQVLASITWEDSYTVLRREVSLLGGWSATSDHALASLPKASRLIAIGLGKRLADPHAVDAALETYKLACIPGEKTRRQVEGSLRAFAVFLALSENQIRLPADPKKLENSEVRMLPDEIAFKRMLRDAGCPNEADADIREAWAATRFLPERPSTNYLTGPVAPSPLPWQQTL